MLGILSFIIGIAGAIPYIWLIIYGKVKPQRTTWGIWTIILILSVAAYRTEGADESLWFLVGDLVVTASIFVLSLWRGETKFTRLDMYCFAAASSGLLLWLSTDSPLLQLVGVMLADMIAIVPTIRSATRFPEQESATTFAASSVAALLGVFAVGTWDPILITYPLYLYSANLVTAIAIYAAQRTIAARDAETTS